MNEEDLSYTTPKRDHFVLSEKIIDHFGGCNRANPQIKKGEVGQQEVHGRVQVRVRGHREHNEEVAHQTRHVEHTGKEEKKNLNLPRIGECQEHKFRYC